MQVFADIWIISVNTTAADTSIMFFQCIILKCGININNRLEPRRKRKLYTQSSHLVIDTHVYRFVRTAPGSPTQLHDSMCRTPKQRTSPLTTRTAETRLFSTRTECHTQTTHTNTHNSAKTPPRHAPARAHAEKPFCPGTGQIEHEALLRSGPTIASFKQTLQLSGLQCPGTPPRLK